MNSYIVFLWFRIMEAVMRCILSLGINLGPVSCPAATVKTGFQSPMSEYGPYSGELYLIGFYPLNYSYRNPLSIASCVTQLLLTLAVLLSIQVDIQWVEFCQRWRLHSYFWFFLLLFSKRRRKKYQTGSLCL